MHHDLQQGSANCGGSGQGLVCWALKPRIKKKKILLMDYKTKQKHICDKDVCGPQSLKYLLLYKKNVADPRFRAGPSTGQASWCPHPLLTSPASTMAKFLAP